MLRIMMVFMMVFLGLEAVPLPIFKTGQTQSYDVSGVVVTDDSIKDDGYYQTGVRQRYTRNDATEIVTDEVTQLKWQDDASVETNDQNWTEAGNYCSTLDLNGETGWRLPSKEELESIVDRGKSLPTLSGFFKYYDSSSDYYWSSTIVAQYTSRAWRVNFHYGSTSFDVKSTDYNVRCVKGEQVDDLNFSRDGTTEVVTESVSNLQWQDDINVTTNNRNWTEAIDYCEALDMAGQTDWRLPNDNELLSLLDSSKSSPATNDTFIHSSWVNYWSSSTDALYTHIAWIVRFSDGYSNGSLKSGNHYVRCVRGGQFDNLKLKSLTKTGQTKSYDENGNEVTDNSIKDDGYYQAGFKRAYSRDDTTKIVTDNTTKLQWQDDAIVTSNDINWTEANSYCSSLILNGVAGWRLPSRDELESIVDRGKHSPALSEDFKNIFLYSYWSSTTNVNHTSSAWNVGFVAGYSNGFNKTQSLYVRCVRGGQFDNLSFSRDVTTEIVTNNVSNLQWQDDADVSDNYYNRKSWIEAIAYCEALTMAGQTDWRLPNNNELLSIIDSSQYNPVINNIFTNISSFFYWSSTTSTYPSYYNTPHAWNVEFSSGNAGAYDKANTYNVRCVRGGELQNKTIMAPIIMYLLN